jgi:transcriptional regulator GlxA family with amidase domain
VCRHGGRLVVVIGFDGIELVDVASVTTGFDYAREPVATIARRCGFGSAESLRQAFVSWVGVSPSQFRGNARTAEPWLGRS